MRADGVDEAPVSEHSGLSPAALRIEISPDQIGLWRLRMSLSLDDARWYLNNRRKDMATAAVRGARFCHREILRIRWHMRNRRDPRCAAVIQRLEAVEFHKPPESIYHEALDRLTPREREYVSLLAKGHKRSFIAELMGLAYGTVAVYHSAASAALGVKSREFQAHAMREGWGELRA